MSVIVKGMKMPENCETCAYQTKGACFAPRVIKGTITLRRMDKDRPDWCPLAEIPPKHGRLIDADALVTNMFKNPISYNAFKNLIERQMTVIKAEDEG